MSEKIRPVSPNFIQAMEEKLSAGRRHGYVGWDQNWLNCTFPDHLGGYRGALMQHLHVEISELVIALGKGDNEMIREECADIANFAMMIADIHGALKP